MNKPFLLIGYDYYYPRGGTRDWIDRYETREEAEVAITNQEYRNDCYEIIDLRDED